MKFSVLLSIYKGNLAIPLKSALDSLLDQTLLPDEVVIVEDGPLTDEVYAVVEAFGKAAPGRLKVVALPVNVGLVNALNEGLKQAAHELVARMDGDDICKPDRFEKQVAFFEAHPEYAIVGAQVEEFKEETGDIVQFRRLPVHHDDIVRYAKNRSPFNHPAIMFRRSVVAAVGYYERFSSDTEDYYLWAKIIHAGYRVANLPDVLLYYRIGTDFVKRRQGIRYVKGEYALLRKLLDLGFISRARFVRNVSLRIPLRVMPDFILNLVYTHLLR